jgi:hypothetical protein
MTTRNTLEEAALILARAKFTTLDTVTITVYRNAAGSAEALDSAACIEQSSSGYFLWPFSSLTNAPTSFSNYLWIMTNGTPAEDVHGETFFGGWPNFVSNLQGANMTTITIKDNQATPVVMEGVSVQVYNSDNTLFKDSKVTDSNGEALFLLDNGAYKIRLQKNQTGFTIPEDLTVSGVTAQEYTGISNVIVSGAGVDQCEVWMDASSLSGGAPSNLTGVATTASLPTLLNGIYYIGEKVNGTYDAANKRIFWILPQGSVIEFSIKDTLGTTKVSKSIPATSTANFQDLEDR